MTLRGELAVPVIILILHEYLFIHLFVHIFIYLCIYLLSVCPHGDQEGPCRNCFFLLPHVSQGTNSDLNLRVSSFFYYNPSLIDFCWEPSTDNFTNNKENRVIIVKRLNVNSFFQKQIILEKVLVACTSEILFALFFKCFIYYF